MGVGRRRIGLDDGKEVKADGGMRKESRARPSQGKSRSSNVMYYSLR